MERVIHIIPTPIGNLEDITLRSLRILKESDLVLAEDTRVTKKLFMHYTIRTKMISYHSFNEHKKVDQIISRIENGEKCSLVSDAGTPGISDPGFLLVRECIKKNIKIVCLPGPTACIPALIQSGFPTDKFHFEGFLPLKKRRKTILNEIMNRKTPTILYESKHRLIKTLKEIAEIAPNRSAAVSKEITKLHETNYRDTVENLIYIISKSSIKGEFVIILNGKK